MPRILVTGAGGFVGQALVPVLDAAGHLVVSLMRNNKIERPMSAGQPPRYRGIRPEAEWTEVFADIDSVVHLAGIAHQLDSPVDSDAYRSVNVEHTRRLALEAAKAGIRRFVFLSTVKVLGEETSGQPFSVSDAPNPRDAYASSKAEAETVLREIEAKSALEVVIIRPPLVYGPRMKGNLAALLGLIERGVPIPLGGIWNQRDLIGVYNLCDLILTCIRHPAAAGKTFLACDGEPLSTVDLIRHLARGAGRRAKVFYVPPWLLRSFASVFGKRKAYEKLSSSLIIDMEETQRVLEWRPPYSVAESFRKSFEED